MRKPTRTGVAAVVLLVAAGCGGGGAPQQGDAVARGGPETLPDDGATVIGRMAGSEPYLFQAISGATFLNDGRVAVADRGASEIRIFDRQGQHLATFGRNGGGPGEFRYLGGIGSFPGQMVLAWDPPSHRVTLLSPDSGFAQTFRLDFLNSFLPRLLGVAEQGRVILLEDATQPPPGGGVADEHWRVLVVNPSRSTADTLGPFDGAQSYFFSEKGRRWVEALPFGRRLQIAVGRQYLYVGNDREGTVNVFRLSGALVRTIDTGLRGEPVTDEDRNRYRESRLQASSPGAAERIRERIRLVPIEQTHPAFVQIFADREGRVWVASGSGGAGSRLWRVIDWAGSRVPVTAEIRLPSSARPLEANSADVAFLTTDSLGVQRLEVRSLDALGLNTD